MNPWDKTPRTPPPATTPAAPPGPAAAPAQPGGPGPETAEAPRPQTNRLNAQTIELVAQANESRARQLRELEEIAAWLQRGLVAEAARLKRLDEQLGAREAKVLDSERLFQEGAELNRRAESLALENRRALMGAQARRDEAQEAERRARQEQQTGQEAALLARKEQAKNQAALDQLRAESAKVEAARAQTLAAHQEAQRLREDAEKLQAHFWPAALRPEGWRSWRERLIPRADAEPRAALLLARLHTATALERSARTPTLELLRDIGESVYETCPDDAEKLAQGLTQAAPGRFEIKTVRVGDRIDRRFMQPAAAGSAEVRAVSGWAVRDAAGKWQFLAAVS